MQNKGEKTMFEDIATIFNRSVSKEEIAEVLNATPEATIEDPREIENDEDLHEIEDETDKDHWPDIILWYYINRELESQAAYPLRRG